MPSSLARLLPAIALATGLVALLPALQEPGDSYDPDLDRKLGRDPLDQGWTLPEAWEDVLGTWQLMEFNHADRWIESEAVGGYMHLGEGVLTMLIHARNSETDDLPEFLAQAGVHRWRIVREDILQTATMMGHSNMGPELEWEQPNTPREFRLERGQAGTLVLERPDGSRLTWSRVSGFAFPEAAKKAIEDARTLGPRQPEEG